MLNLRYLRSFPYVLASLWIISRGLMPINAYAEKYTDEVDRDFSIRTRGKLHLTNAIGDISIQGWALDKIRIKFRKETEAESLEKAKELFETTDYRITDESGEIDVSSQYGNKLSIEDRLQQKVHPKVRLNMTILAPPYLNLKVWSVGGNVLLKNWNSQTEIRGNQGSIQVEGVKADKLEVQCLSCVSFLKDIYSSLSYLGGDGKVTLENAQGKFIYIETTTGSQRLNHVQGHQLYVSQSGGVQGQDLLGQIEFHSKDAPVDFQGLSGFLSGWSESGKVTAWIRDWKPLDLALIETVRGNISILFPENLSAELDLWSVGGATTLSYPLLRTQDLSAFGPEPSNHFIGQIGDGGKLLRVFSEWGDVAVLQGRI